MEVVIFESNKGIYFGKKGLNNDFCRRNEIRCSTMSTGSGSKEKVIFFFLNRTVTFTDSINQIAKRGGNAERWGGVARTEPEGGREC